MFLRWLDGRDRDRATCDQADIDLWHVEGNEHDRKSVRAFLLWSQNTNLSRRFRLPAAQIRGRPRGGPGPGGGSVRRGHGNTSTARTIRPSAARGSGSRTSASRSRPVSTRPRLTASYNATCPRRCSGASDKPTRVLTGPSAHSTASASSNNASARRVRQACSLRRKCDSSANASPCSATRGTLDSTAFAPIPRSFLVEAQDQAKAAHTTGINENPDRPRHLLLRSDPEVKRQVEGLSSKLLGRRRGPGRGCASPRAIRAGQPGAHLLDWPRGPRTPSRLRARAP